MNQFKPVQQSRQLALWAYCFKIYTLPQAQYFLREFKVVSTIKKLNSSFHFGRVARRKTTQLAQNERGRKISQNRNTDFMKLYLNHRWDNRCVLGDIYKRKNQFWAGLGSKKSLGRLRASFAGVFLCFQGQENYFKKIKNIIVSKLKSCVEKKVKNFFFWSFFLILLSFL